MSTRDKKRAGTTVATVVAVVLALVLGACGSGDEGDGAEDAPDYAPAIAKAPPDLQALYEQGGVLAPGGLDAFEDQLAELEGYPVVVNNWASWCGPCRTEWPWFQNAAAEHAGQVAFMGVDGDDTDEAAATFLTNYPVPYPSYADPDEELANAVGTTLVGGFPNTLFFDPDGELLYVHQGVYPDEETFLADLEKFALSDT